LKTITLITNSEVLSFEDTIKLSRKLSRIGLNRIQIRERNISHNSLTNFIKKMKDSIEESCELFVNGNFDLAIENNLNGVHFPEKYPIDEYQNKENLILGRSIHENTNLNKHRKKFDYFHLGPIFVTQSHPNQNTIKEKNITYISRKLSNVIFVGGINTNNVSKLLKYNFSGIAVMRELLLSRSPEKTFMKLRKKINE
tara:strand:+ start:1070 stop:1663 length:594 start_codon:yes stop_codon:yes gene_type:complete